MSIRDLFMGIIASVFVLGLVALIAAEFLLPIPQGAEQALNITIGALLGGVTVVLQYYFGSSASSQAKDTTIANMAGKPVVWDPPSGMPPGSDNFPGPVRGVEAIRGSDGPTIDPKG